MLKDRIKRSFAALPAAVLISGMTIFQAAAFTMPDRDPVALYGNEISFDVIKKGGKVGTHRVVFSRKESGDLGVESRFQLTMTFLTIPIYEFLYRSDAIWREGRLKNMTVEISDGGDNSTIRALPKGQGLAVSGPRGEVDIPGPIYPTNHWNAGVLSQKQVLNTLNGQISQVVIADAGRETIKAEGALVEARKFQYSGDIDTTVWYDDEGRWLKMRFTAKNGSVVDYECTRCGLGRIGKVLSN